MALLPTPAEIRIGIRRKQGRVRIECPHLVHGSITQEEIDSYYMDRIDEDLDFVRLSTNGKPEHYIPPSDSVLLNDIWFDLPISSSKEVQSLFDRKKVFSNPKQTRMIQRILGFVSDDALVLDIFAGSGTAGHAVMAQNSVDTGRRRFILVQLQEPLDPNNKDQKAALSFCDQLENLLTLITFIQNPSDAL